MSFPQDFIFTPGGEHHCPTGDHVLHIFSFSKVTKLNLCAARGGREMLACFRIALLYTLLQLSSLRQTCSLPLYVQAYGMMGWRVGYIA
jgi:hypothetical protein